MLERAYEFYPKNIEGLNDAYNEQIEIINLISKSEEVVKNEYKKWIEFIGKLNSFFENKIIIDKTIFFISQPSFSVQISDKNEAFSYNIYLSFLIPYYYVSNLNHHSSDPTIEMDSNCDKVYNKEIDELHKLINTFFKVQIFPKSALNEIVSDISFETIPANSFTFRNAFFNKKNILI